jgi:hydroxymethylbilane synthase
MNSPLRIGTRDSALALWQAQKLQKELHVLGLHSTLKPIKSEGDLNLTQPLYAMGTTGIFTKSLDTALLNNQIDLAIHSMKDVPTQLPQGIKQAAVLERGPLYDVVVWKNKSAKNKSQRTIATGSLRRKAQWLNKYPHDNIVPLRGNIQTRLEKLRNSNWDGAVFAQAALSRLGIQDELIDPLMQMLPAAAQGALLILCREENLLLKKTLLPLNHTHTALCTHIERTFLHALEGGCTAPIGALAQVIDQQVVFSGGIYSLKNKAPIIIERAFPLENCEEIGILLASELLQNGGTELMSEFKSQ